MTTPGPSRFQGAHVELRDVSKSFGGARPARGQPPDRPRIDPCPRRRERRGQVDRRQDHFRSHPPGPGQLLLGGEPVRFRSPRDAISRGIVLIAQEMSIVPSLSVAENVFLGIEPRQAGFLRRRALSRRYSELAGTAGFELSGELNAGGLRTADQQKVEILRALCRNAGLIVMDEPTAALSGPDVAALHEVIRRLARSGTTVVLVSHLLGEVLQLADEVTILRDGHIVRTTAAAGQTEESLLNAMLGRSVSATFPARQRVGPDAPVVLSVRGLTAPGVSGVSFDLRAGEIVGLAGLVGAGRTELARAVYQAHRTAAGTVSLAGGERLTRRHRADGPRAALRAGVAMIPESRKEHGLLPRRSVRENVSLASLGQLNRAGIVRRRPERQTVEQMLRRVDVRARSQAMPADALSGGNQQKLLFARMLLCQPRVLIADEPTRGVDVGAKRAIYELLTTLTADGVGILLISSEVEEIIGLAHRVLVMRTGQIAAELSGDEVTEAAILSAAFGATERGAS